MVTTPIDTKYNKFQFKDTPGRGLKGGVLYVSDMGLEFSRNIFPSNR
jgi:hypothetical protein